MWAPQAEGARLLSLTRDWLPLDAASQAFNEDRRDKALRSTFPTLRLYISQRCESLYNDAAIFRVMSLDPPTYLASLQNNIRARPIPWDGAVRAGTISEDQLNKIKAVDKVRKEQRKQAIESDLDAYRTLFVGGANEKSILESAAKRGDVVQYILVLLGDLIDGACFYISNLYTIP